MMTRTLITILLSLIFSMALAQDRIVDNFFNDVNPATLTAQSKNSIPARHYRLVQIDLNQLYAELENVPHQNGLKSGLATQIALPLPDGSNAMYRIVENSALDPELSRKYPTIKTYDAHGITHAGELVKLDLTNRGLHAMILIPGQSPVFIDPLQKKDQLYVIYHKKDFNTPRHLKCGVKGQTKLLSPSDKSNFFANFYPCQLKKYRLAMSATAEYTQYHGGTVNDALAAQATTINRVNGIYETEMAITMQLIANNDQIIFTNPNNQPFTSGDPDELIEENQVTVDQIIGPANYDIGHVVDAGGSGLAELASVCINGKKAMGVTGTTNPIGDPFDIDYVAHEMGHQFGANHVQNNNCNRNDATAVEPGSGSTIMGYAGICSPNVQKNSDAYFNGISLQEMGNVVSSPTHACPIKTPIASAPVIHKTTGGFVVPILTPFGLSATASQHEGHGVLTYSWEQQDNEISPQPPVSSAVGGPNFRSFLPQLSNTRIFPNLGTLNNGGPFTWEVLSSVPRIMKFRVSVRSNTPGGSCNAYADTRISTTNAAGPFVVTSPTDKFISWVGLTPQNITWDVANTNFFPVSALYVNIFLSLDGGQTYPYTLALNTPNNGIKSICVPNVTSNTARILIQASNGTFFNISQNNFSIVAVPPQAPVLTRADRNGMNTREAFVLYAGCLSSAGTAYMINGLPGANIRLDSENNRFIIGNIMTPKRVRNITITAVDENNIGRTSNPITIPGIL